MDPIRVLVVDNHQIMREGVVAILDDVEDILVVGEAADGQEAVDQLRSIAADVVLMDLLMPRMSGFEATRLIVQEHPDVRIIGLSMHRETALANAMREAGGSGYLSKDVSSDDLVRTIREVVQK